MEFNTIEKSLNQIIFQDKCSNYIKGFNTKIYIKIIQFIIKKNNNFIIYINKSKI